MRGYRRVLPLSISTHLYVSAPPIDRQFDRDDRSVAWHSRLARLRFYRTRSCEGRKKLRFINSASAHTTASRIGYIRAKLCYKAASLNFYYSPVSRATERC